MIINTNNDSNNKTDSYYHGNDGWEHYIYNYSNSNKNN